MRVLATGSSLALLLRPTSTLSGDRLPVPAPVLSTDAAASMPLSVAAPAGVVVAGWLAIAPGCDPATPGLDAVCPAPGAVAAAALSAACLSLASSIVHAPSSRPSPAAAILQSRRIDPFISPSRG